ncbi:MAG: GHKL domain-containing protein [Clostridium sp.]|nr:GHKL domain-containing protein [Clostridium sp.]
MEPEIYNLYYEIVFYVGRGAKQLITGIMLASLCRHFMVGGAARRRVWTVGAAYFAVIAAFLYTEVEVYAFTAYLSAFFAAFLVLFCLEKENRQVKFLLCYVFFAVYVLASDAASDLTYFLAAPVDRWIILRAGMTQEAVWRACFLSFCLFRVAECILAALILWLLCRGILRIFFFSRNGMEKKEMVLLMLPPVLGIVYYIGRVRNGNLVWQETGMYMNEMIPEYEVLGIVTQVILLATILSMLWLYQKLKQEQGERQSARLLLQEVKGLRAHIEEVERLHADLRGMRHDMRNHISVLYGLMERGAFGEARAYLDSMGRMYIGAAFPGAETRVEQTEQKTAEKDGARKERVEQKPAEKGAVRAEREKASGTEEQYEQEAREKAEMSRRREKTNANAGSAQGQAGTEDLRQAEILTGNPVTDVVLAEHQRRIADAGAVLEADFHYPDSEVMDAFDLSVILDNALTNAREAVTPGGWVRIRSFREHDVYLIAVENTFAGELSGTGAEGLPMTTKHPAEAHGFGLRHIKTVAEHYHGTVTIEQKGDWVALSVMLCI